MTYTTEDVLAMITDGRLVPSDLPSRRLSAKQVVVEVKNKQHFDVLTLPARYVSTGLLDTILHYFTLPGYAVRLGIGAKAQFYQTVKEFFAFIDNHLEFYVGQSEKTINTGITLPARCFSDWLDYLKRTNTTLTTYIHMSHLLKIVSRTMAKRYGKVSKWPTDQKESWRVLKANTPRKPSHNKNPPLGRYLGIPPKDFTNKELYMGLRYGVIWLLKKLQVQRNAFLDEPAIRDTLLDLQGYKFTEFNRAFSGLKDFLSNNQRARFKKNFDRLEKIAPAAWRQIQHDPLLTEWQFYSWIKLRPALIPDDSCMAHPFPAKLQQLMLQRLVEDSENLTARAKSYGRKDHAWAPLKPYLGNASNVGFITPCFWGADWLVHTELERLLMVWLLATERAQKSGIEKLTFDGIHLSHNKADLQISTLKLRRASNPSARNKVTDVESTIYKRRASPVYEIYHDWLAAEQHAKNFLANYNSKRSFINGHCGIYTGNIASNSVKQITTNFLPLELLNVPGTIWHDTFIQETEMEAERNAQAFIAILQNRVAQKRAEPNMRVSLTTGPIGQSLVVEQELDNNQQTEKASIDAEVMGHNEQTGRQYKDGFARLGIDEIIEPVRAFARKVGDDKIQLAEKLAAQMSDSERKVSLTELQTICGVESVTVDQAELLAILDDADKLTIAGEICHDGETLIVETDMTAGLMWSYIEHLEADLLPLMTTNRDDATIKHLSKLIHLHQVYKQFDKQIQYAGRQLAAEIAFPFPSLT